MNCAAKEVEAELPLLLVERWKVSSIAVVCWLGAFVHALMSCGFDIRVARDSAALIVTIAERPLVLNAERLNSQLGTHARYGRVNQRPAKKDLVRP